MTEYVTRGWMMRMDVRRDQISGEISGEISGDILRRDDEER
jgi:hypothetical protein